jgi:hypothetical protein
MVTKFNDDSRNSSPMRFFPAHKVETMHNLVSYKSTEGDYMVLSQYDHLREHPIDLEAIPLTDKQLMVVSLVFYGRVKKARAAHALKVSFQSLDNILIHALKKIEESLTT